jgi:hypothetical protein
MWLSEPARLATSSHSRMLLVEVTDIGRQVADASRAIAHPQQKLWLEIL